jgi:putative transposase
VHAWVLMANHYHLFIQTPEANLVEGMKWFQNTYTRRFNVRHKNWGRLFGDRYKAILVEGKGRYYYETLLDYIHLNPVRAGLVNPQNKESVLDCPWSSIVEGYALPLSKRKDWMACKEGLEMFGCADTAAGRRKMIERLDRRAIELKTDGSDSAMTIRELNEQCNELNKRWYSGTEEFSEKILLLAENVFNKQRSRAYNSAAEHKAHGVHQAKMLLHQGLKSAHLTEEDLLKVNGSDSRKVFIALLLKSKTTVSNGWLAEHLKMKSAANVSYRLKNVDVKKLKKQLQPELFVYAKSQGFEI